MKSETVGVVLGSNVESMVIRGWVVAAIVPANVIKKSPPPISQTSTFPAPIFDRAANAFWMDTVVGG